jgi:hypothetical protein
MTILTRLLPIPLFKLFRFDPAARQEPTGLRQVNDHLIRQQIQAFGRDIGIRAVGIRWEDDGTACHLRVRYAMPARIIVTRPAEDPAED